MTWSRNLALCLALAGLTAPAHADDRGSPRTDPARAQQESAAKESGEEEAKRPSIRITLSDPSAAPRVKERNTGVSLVSGEAPEVRPRRGGNVLFSVEDADLTTEVLPLIEEQVGVRIRYRGAPKAVTLKLVQPVAWQAALELICQFSGTHLARDHYGRLEIKSRFGGQPMKDGLLFDDIEGQLDVPEHIASLQASARRQATTLAKEQKARQPQGEGAILQIGNPRPMQFGPQNGRQAPRVGPRRAPGPRRIGPRRVGPRVAPGPRVIAPQRTGPRRVQPGF